MELAFLDATQDARVRENIHAAAYGTSPLGAPLLCPPASLNALSSKTLADYRALVARPEALVLAGAGVGHEELIDLAQTHFEPHLPPKSPTPTITESPYVGGCVLAEEKAPTPAGFAVETNPQVRIACAMRAAEGGWHSKDLIAVCVLQTLLGGGDSFSAGGPGKGMYSRLYREVLNRYHWVEGCAAFVSIHDREGLLGIVGACAPPYAQQLTEVLMSNLLRLGQQPVDRAELDRAKNMLKVNVLTQLESRLVLFEDVARQVATFGRRQTLQEMTAAVDAVSEEDILRIGSYMCAAPPSVAAHGEDLSKVPPFEQVASWRLR
jgi:processing peptidase subunit alpha